jgi:glycosyltransferase involved in cell wall biosynthesis
MTNAALLFHPEAYDTSGPQLMGRHSAGESFLRGFLRYADVDRFYFWNIGSTPAAQAEVLLNRIEAVRRPVTWIPRGDLAGLGVPGAMFSPAPALVQEAWNRRRVGPRRYSITGITHTTATAQVMDALANQVLAPVEPWDALICTSSAVADSLSWQLETLAEYLRGRLGAAAIPKIRLETIPLGINVEDFATSEADRKRWRAELGIPDDAVVALYVGRFSIHSKMNPAPMARALATAARETGKPVHWVLSGWAGEKFEAAYKQTVRDHAGGVTVHFVDGRKPEARFSIWSVADLFLSLSDNIQETYGLTPVEAMAAGLPCVVSDWDGYKDTVRHGVDGFRIPTYSPPPGMGADFAFRFFNNIDSYDAYIAGASQLVAVDPAEAASAIIRLIEEPELRRRMGAAARERARAVFDWSAIIPRYQALWGELSAIRTAGQDFTPARDNPWRPDPFSYFSNYPTEALRPDMRFVLADGADAASAAALLKSPASNFAFFALPNEQELPLLFASLKAKGPQTPAELATVVSPARRPAVERAVLWLLKHGFVSVVNGRKTPLD